MESTVNIQVSSRDMTETMFRFNVLMTSQIFLLNFIVERKTFAYVFTVWKDFF